MSMAGQILRSRTLAALTSPHGVDRYLKQLHPMWAVHEVRARVVDVRRETAGPSSTATLVLSPTESWRGHRAGQHVSVGVEIGARRRTRVFTISSAESRPGEPFTITVRAHGPVSTFLARDVRPGAILHLSQAEGEFVLPDRVPEHIVLISGGSGITPVMAMLRSLRLRTHRGRVTFLHWSHTAEEQIYAAELEEVRRSGYGVDVHLLHPGQGDPYLSPALLERLVPGYRDLSAWACGPQGLIEAARSAFGDGLRVEWFKPPRPTTTGSTGTVTFGRSGTTTRNDGQVLLQQAETAGLSPEFGCRMGICFTCTATKTAGVVRNVLTGDTSASPDEEIRLCVSAPEGDCTLDI